LGRQHRQEDHSPTPAQTKSEKQSKARRAVAVAQVIKYLASKHKALNSNLHQEKGGKRKGFTAICLFFKYSTLPQTTT
jgi:hypothetical protein